MPDRPRPRDFRYNANVASIVLDCKLLDDVSGLAAMSGCTPAVSMLAALFAVVYRYTGERDILIGSSVDGREGARVSLVGPSATTIPLRGDCSDDPTFLTLQTRTQCMFSRACELRRLPLAQLIEIANPVRDASRNALFSIHVSFERAIAAAASASSQYAIVEVLAATASILYDINMRFIDQPDGLRVVCEYRSDLYEAETIASLLASYRILLQSVTRDPEQTIDRAPILNPELRRELMVAANGTLAPYPGTATLPELIAQQAQRTPDVVAVQRADNELTYAQLEARAAALGRRILAVVGKPGRHVGILLDRSGEMIVAMLAVLKAGCAYIPLDPKYPSDRLTFIARDSALAATVTRPDLGELILTPEIPRVHVDESPCVTLAEHVPALLTECNADAIAYVIYTSGSTGKPNGVQISHASLINFLWAMRVAPGIDAGDVLVAVTTISFDIAGLEVFLPLVCGASVVVASELEVRDGAALLELVRQSAATVMQATPITWQLLIDAGWRGDPPLKMLCGGEALPRPLADALLECSPILWNMYGPTETTIWSAAARVSAGTGPPLIGSPIANTQFYVLGNNGQLVPPGVAGELFIGGAGLARGYFGRDDLTRERFVTNPFVDAADARMYRTGDIVRARPSGYEFLGRTDHQIKLRGFRIEPDEIAAVLRRQSGVAEATVIAAQHNGEMSLCAYVVPEREAVADLARWPTRLREQLAQALPNYMLPAAFGVLDRLPRTPNGKVDRNALPAIANEPAGRPDEAPPTATQVGVARIARELLSLPTIGRKSDLFALGLHSLIVVRLIARIGEEFGVALTVRAIFDRPTVSAIALAIDESPTEHIAKPSAKRPVAFYNRSGTKPPLIFFHNDAHADGLYCRRLAAKLGPHQPLLAVAPHGSAGQPVLTRIENMARDHVRLLKTILPNGPYRIGGHCYGALVAFEVAHILRSRGDDVEQVVLSNVYAPIAYPLPGYDAFMRWIGLNESLDSDVRTKICGNIVGLAYSIANGHAAALRFIVERICSSPKLRERARQNLIDHPEIAFRPTGSHETRRLLGELVARNTYHPRPYAGAISLIWSVDEPVDLGDPTKGDPTRGWARFASSVSVTTIAGGHCELIREHIDEYGELLANALNG